MSLKINWDALQSYLVEERTVSYIKNTVEKMLSKKGLFSSSIEIEKLKFGSAPPSIEIISMEDIVQAHQWEMVFHSYPIQVPANIDFKAPFECVISINTANDGNFSFNSSFSYDEIAPGCIKFPFRADLSNLEFHGEATVQYLCDSIVVFFKSIPTVKFNLDVHIGADIKLRDDHQIRDFIYEILDKWLTANIVLPNALRLPFTQKEE